MVPRLVLPRVQVLGRRVGPCKRLCCVPGQALQDMSGQGNCLGCQPTALAAGAQPQNMRLYGRGAVKSLDGCC